jgi:hypothetical protein
VASILAPAAALTFGAVHAAFGDNGPLFILPPAVLALALVGTSVWVARARSFAPAPKPTWDYGTSASLARWTKHREDMDAAKQTKESSAPPAKV